MPLSSIIYLINLEFVQNAREILNRVILTGLCQLELETDTFQSKQMYRKQLQINVSIDRRCNIGSQNVELKRNILNTCISEQRRANLL